MKSVTAQPNLLRLFQGFLALAGIASIPASPAAETVDFARDVRPILARHCFKCHGPDDNKRAAGLRLDSAAGALGETKSGNHAIVPKDLEASELVARIHSDDPTEIMPPPETKDPLSPEQKQILKNWIATGGQYAEHWSFVPPTRPNVSQPDNLPAHWRQNPIDAFIFQKLQSLSLNPQPQADKEALIRRVSLDLTGIPPTPSELEKFLSDTRPDAYERLVDRLLASPRYGERWARKWLDLARYADTNGYEKDRYRSIWPYRDWVINALNADMPFDEFTIRQLAGDMLPNATDKDRIATGFHRNTMLNEEGGIDPLEFRFYAMVDRVGTTSTVWMGMTLACAQCHNHKYDPLTQSDFYRLMASLNNAEEPPAYNLSNQEIELSRRQIDRQIAEIVGGLRDQFPAEPLQGSNDKRSERTRRDSARKKAFDTWLTTNSAKSADWSIISPNNISGNLARFEKRPDGSIFATGDATKHDEYFLTLPSLPAGTTAIRLEVLPDPALPAGGPGRTDYEGPLGDFFLSEFQLRGADGKANPALKIASASESYGKLGIGGGDAKAALALDGNMQTGWSTQGHQGQADQAVFVLEKPLDKATEASLTMIFERHYSAPLGRFRLWSTTSKSATYAKKLSTSIEQLLAKPAETRTYSDLQTLENYWLQHESAELKDQHKKLAALEASRPKPVSTLVMKERPADFQRPTFIHRRGEFLQPTKPVSPGAPEFLSAKSANSSPGNRLELARWLVSNQNPLAARVTVNRQWAAIFGRGLVRTQEDFGYQGELPTHPELLDWLATTFVNDDKWSLKRLHRRMVTSQAYRQSSQVTPESITRDPDNRYLSHGPRFRMDGEIIRDSALAVAGLLSPKMGGPSVYPPQPESVTTEGAYGRLAWSVSQGEDRFRRSLYTFAKRTTPFAMLNTLDAPSGEACVVRRDVSNSALQSLTLLNDITFLESAQALGREFSTASGNDLTKLERLYRRIFCRLPNATEAKLLAEFLAGQKAFYEQNKAEARALIGESGGERADQSNIAAWTALARALLNTDEFVVHR